jgi:methylmalonyl-CoA mutase
MHPTLFSEFTPTNFDDWKQQVLKDLKGKSFEDTLLWHTAEGMVLQPYYTSEQVSAGALQGHFEQKTNGWLNEPVVHFENEKATNAKIINVLEKGAEAVLLDLGGRNVSEISFPKLLHGIKLSDAPVFFKAVGQELALAVALRQFIAYQMKGGLLHDPLAHWTQTGQWTQHWANQTATLLHETVSSPHFKTIFVHTQPFHNAGANAVQELAFGLSSAATYLDHLTDLGLSAETIANKLVFSVSVGTNYFMEIAKLRALRHLWAVLLRQWLPEAPTLPSAFIHAQTSTFYNAAAAPYTNLLRATTQAMSATVGGCDALTVLPYNEISGQRNDEFAERIARNLSVLLKEESHLDKTTDPAAGSYFIETLTQQLSEAAWALFLQVEQKGGFVPAFEQGFVQDEIEKTFVEKQQKVQTGEAVLVGVNKYQTPNDTLDVPQKTPVNESSLKLLIDKRLADFA